MTANEHHMVLMSLSANRPLAEKIAKRLHQPLADVNLDRFADGEIRLNITNSVRGDNVFVIAPTSASPHGSVNDNIMELFIAVDALRRASAHAINIVMPYYGYARQDRKSRSRESIAARVIADHLEQAGVTRVIAFDLHASQIQGFFDIPVDHLMGAPILADYLISHHIVDLDNAVVVSPDHGGVRRARELNQFLGLPDSYAVIDKRRPVDKKNTVEVMNLIGDVSGKTAIIIDDMIDTGHTIVEGAKLLRAKGAKKIIVVASHALLSGDASKLLQKSDFDHVIVTDSIDIPESKRFDKLQIVSADDLFAKAITAVQENGSVSPLFQNKYHRGFEND
ncbi:ribose-phosphate diphosphokinase [Oenococcus oeni]|uniref:ribose-phosphate diphosphokinase n=1 Tax=Oenococcus oeni TaxID=1247 RepID=UPI0012DAD61A|nr:ribose-phosphate pyrophosphokinase [Oenococcus oeni]QGR00735.1 ribose-phosphate pyrophosphokinase [Oenococcus oeni]